MFEFVRKEAESGSRDMQIRYGRCLRDGRGVESDPYAAIRWMRLAADQGLYGAKVEYFDLLWKLNDKSLDAEMFEFVRKEAESGSRDMQIRYGRCLRDGRGC